MAKKVTKETVKEPTPKTFQQPDVINKDFQSDDNEVLNLKVTKELLDNNPKIGGEITLGDDIIIEEYSTLDIEELLNAVKILLNDLDGIFIGGHAQQSKQYLEQLINHR